MKLVTGHEKLVMRFMKLVTGHERLVAGHMKLVTAHDQKLNFSKTGHQTRWSWPDWSQKAQDPFCLIKLPQSKAIDN